MAVRDRALDRSVVLAVVHPRAEYWRSRRGARFRILGPLWVAMWVAAGAITWPWRHVLLYDNAISWLAAALFFAAGFYLYYRGRARFSFAQLMGARRSRAIDLSSGW